MHRRLVALLAFASAWAPRPALGDDDAGLPGLPAGVHWVRRAGGRCGQAPTRDGGVRLTGATSCAPVTVQAEAARATLTLPLEGLTLHLSRARREWTIDTVSLRRGKPELVAREGCRQPLEFTATDGGLRTGLGTLFRDKAACEQAPGYDLECPPDGCDEVHDAQPLTLGRCEAARGLLETRTAPLRVRDEDATLATMTKLRALAVKGGLLWTPVLGLPRCVALTARPVSPGEVELTHRSTTTGEERVVRRARYGALFPLTASARRESSQEERFDASGQSLGGSGSAGGVSVGLFVGDGALLLDEQLLFFKRAACDAHAAQAPFRSTEAHCLEGGLRRREP